MKIFLKKSNFIIGDSCSGKTFLYKKIKINKIDLDYFIKYKLISFKHELYFRIIEKILLKILKNKYNFLIILGGGAVYKFFVFNILFYKYNSIINQIKNLINDFNNRPTLKNLKYLKIRFCIRKKMYIKIANFYLLKCLKCNIEKIL
ncbi:hypothetical protein [Candidatus Carsonella ruddii]|uniref:Uncharacterized protein n=1 Tax=Carsonella ruddii TaxID=114186 RepID=A0AAE7G406_CARRU|nr:hypothetical protein [Candidatus Carsonella ruddii]AGS06518.1 hypothetical protein CRDC_00150 [Candidatus Carsonella ruddii DC]ALA96779.1 hypothetical protein AMC76_00145 [Candidatus Carsonella ruddii]QLK14000.1 hypothetical protein FK493_00140 [Candidatus Carsonella ruddii]